MMGWTKCLNLRDLVLMALIFVVNVQHGNCNNNNNNNNNKGSFVQRSGTQFVLNGKPIYLNGFNSYWLMYIASDPSTSSKVTSTLQEASKHGLNIARTWAFNDGGSDRSLQVSPGKYDENVFKGLDFVVTEAGKYGVRLILSLVNNWDNYGGKKQYIQWARDSGQHINNEDDFFTHPLVKYYYKNHIKAVLTRKNTITGVTYKDDPAIFAWELMNEPRSLYDHSGKIIQDWVSEMGAYVKSIDGNHLLQIGLEGFYGEKMPERKEFNFQVGTDFISNNQVPEIDFATIHLYPESWLPGADEAAQSAFVEKWVKTHIEDTDKILRKPILVSEFGKSSKSSGYSVQMRDSYFDKLYGFIYESASHGGSCAGGLFWQLMAQGMDSFGDGYQVIFQETPSTTTIIDQQSHKMSNLA